MRNQVFKKLFSALLALIMVAGLLPASVLAEGWTAADVDSTPAPAETVQPTESAEPTEPAETETPEVTEVPAPTPENPATTDEPTAEPAEGEEPAEPVQEETPAPEDGILLAAENVTARDTSKDGFYRIVHLDCGREYFSKDWIIALINEMAAAGYNQLQLAFGNGGFRFYLNDMAVDKYSSDEVKNALEYGNTQYNTNGDNGKKDSEWKEYNPTTNALTESEMDAIITHAQSKGIEIVPMLNTPGHMNALLHAMSNLGIGEYSNLIVSSGCMKLSVNAAVDFTEKLVEKYITYFSKHKCKFFNLAMDEYYGSDGKTTSFTAEFFAYANKLIGKVISAGMTPRVFNDALTSSNNGSFTAGTQVCCWDSIKNTDGYSVINTSHDFYYVSTNEAWNLNQSTDNGEGYTFVGNYDENKWVEHAKKFNNNTFLYKRTPSTINSPVGSMFCIWCNTPGKQNETTIAQQIRMILRVIGARMQGHDNYSASDVLVEGGFKADGTINADKVYSGTGTTKESTDKKDEVIVSAVGLKTLTATKVAENLPAIEGAAENKIVAYDVTPYTDNKTTKHIGEATVSIAIPEGWDTDKVRGFVVESSDSAKGNVETIEGKVEDGYYTFTAPHFSVMGIYEQAVTYVEETVTVVVGGSETVTVDGTQGEKVENGVLLAEDGTTIANYKVEHVSKTGGTTRTVTGEVTLSGLGNGETADVLIGDWQAQDATEKQKRPLNYMVVADGKISYTTDVNKATVFTVTNVNNNYYTIKVKDDNKYIIRNNSGLSISDSADQDNSWSVGTGNDLYYYYQSGRNYYYYYLTYSNNNQWGVSNSISDWKTVAHPYSFKTETTQAEEKTEITFTGVAEGTTSVVIGGTRYTVNVVDKTLTENYIYVNYFITNQRVTGSDGVQSKKVLAAEVNTEEGKALSEIAAQTGTYTSGNVSKNVKYYKSELQLAEKIQTHEGWTNKIGQGTVAEKLRYWENKWSVYNGKEWVTIDTTIYSTTTDPETYAGKEAAVSTNIAAITAYYLLKTDVTQEITTYATDWGEDLKDGDDFSEYSLLDFAVVYKSDNKRSPDSFANSKTLVYNNNAQKDYKWSGGGDYARYIKDIYAENTSNYEVYMITVTENSGQFSYDSSQSISSSTTITYPAANEKVAWALSEDDFARSGLEKYTDYNEGGEPIVSQIYAKYRRAYLVTYYVRLKETVESKLTVNYYVEGASDPFYTYHIGVKADTKFDEGFARTVDPVGLINNTVENSLKVTETVQWELEKMPEIGAQYRYSDYTFTRVKLDTTDYKTVNLYYTFSSTKTFVVDYGLPLVIQPKDVNTNLGNNNVNITNVIITRKSTYASITTDNSHDITYTLTEMISGNDTFSVKYEGTLNTGEGSQGGETGEYTVTIIPATTVYYEDSFAKFTDGSGAAEKATWGTVGEAKDATQALEALGTKENVYGYDDAYKDSTMFSMGSARKVTVTNDMAKDGVVWPTAQFTFKGTGFDIISLTDNTSGAIYVDVYTGDKVEGTPKKYVVNNYYGYDYVGSEWVVKKDEENNALYQIPVIKIKDLDYGTYTVVIKVAYSAFQDVADKKQYSFWLDAVRVYDPMGANNSDTYAPDGEAKPVFVEVRDMLLSASSVAENNTNNGAVFIDGNGSAAIATDYKNFGPNHEVYLANNQAIAFKIADATQYADIQIGIKSTGNSAVKYKINNGTEATIGTATDMYYSVKDYASNGSVVTITNTGETVLSITNIKCTMGTSSAKTDTVDLVMSAEDVAVAISMVNSAITPVEPEPEPEPEKTFEPERFEASWSKNVMQGRKATLTVKTSEDVEAIAVDGQTVSSYRTRTERVGFGRRAKRITYREFTFSMVAQETADFSITAINAEGIESEAITARLTVQKRPSSVRDVWNWFKGWF